MSQELGEDNLDQYIHNFEKVIVKYSADWSSNCQRLKPEFEKIAKEHEDIKFIIVDPDKFPNSRKLADVNYLPTIAAFLNGEIVSQVQTAKSERLQQLVAHLD